MVKKLLLPAAVVLLPLAARAQNVGIGTASPNSKAALDITASGRGLLIPRMDSATRVGITSPPTGLMVFQNGTTTPTRTRTGFYYYGGGAWLYLPDKTTSGDNLGNHSATQDVVLNGNDLKLNTSADDNSKLTYDATTAGPVLTGGTGGVLGYRSGSTTTPVLVWNNTSSGRVGIGLGSGVAPSRVLDVAGAVRLRTLATAGYVTTDNQGVLSSVAIPADQDNQTLSLNGQILSISGPAGSSVTLPSGGGSPSGAAGGDLTGTYPSPQLGTGVVGANELATDAVTNAKVANDAIGLAELSAGGTPSGSNYLRGDNTWATPTPASLGAWSLTGNALDGNQFIGSTNDQDFIVKRNNTEAFRVYSSGRVSIGNNSPGSSSVMLGFNTGATLSSGAYNTFVGAKAGETNNNNNNTLVGYGAGQQSTGNDNTMLGYFAGYRVSGGANNVFIGSQAASLSAVAAVGGNNVVIGASAGTTLNGSSNSNILIGSSANATAGLTNAYAIGNEATVTQGNSLVIGTAPGSAGAVYVGIGTSAPTSSLQVKGTFAVGVINNYGGGSSAGNANGLDQGAVNATNITGGYYGLNPTSSNNQYYKLPAASACPGRIYYLRNNSSSTNAIISTDGGSIYAGSSTSPLANYTLNAGSSVKTIIAISDGTNWTVGKLD